MHAFLHHARSVGPSVILGALLSTTACGGSTAPHADGDHATHATPTKGGTLPILLNDGAKWKMDDHTRKTMGHIRTTLHAAAVTTPEEATALGTELQAQLGTLIDGCTMDGEAHDQLHVFLMAYQPAVAALKAAPDAEAAHGHLAEVRALVDAYGDYFE